MATITRTSDAERERLRRSASAADQGPTEEDRRYTHSIGLMDEFGRLGDPQDPTNVSFPFLRRMRRDHMVSMGLHFIAMPIVRAPWYFESDSAQISAFCDKLIRPIYGRLVITILRFLWSGYSPGAKNFEVINPNWVYYDDNSKSFKQVWDGGTVGATVFKPVTALRPENAKPTYKDGNFTGITYDRRYGGIGYWVIDGQQKPDIDLLHSMWAVHDQDNEDGCQPAGEMVLTTEGYVAIEKLDHAQHKLVSYNPAQNKIHRGLGNRSHSCDKGFGFQVFTRPHEGDMLTISVNGKSMRATPNHKLTVKWDEKAVGRYCVYLMRRGKDWRIGTTQILNQKSKQTNSGVGSRMQREGAEHAWILETFDSRREALLHEAMWSHQYQVPDMCFKACHELGEGMQQDDIDQFWQGTQTTSGALELLAECGRQERLPMYEQADGSPRARQAGLRNKWTINAGNLIPGLMLMPTDPGQGMTPDWNGIKVERESFDGTVYSLQVDPYKHYVSGGVITRNSPFGFPRIAHCAPIFHMYRWIWTLLGRGFENSADPGPVVRYPREDIPTLDSEGNPVKNVQVALRIGRRKRSGSTVALPSDNYTDITDKPTGVKKWDIEYPKGDTDFESIQKFIGYLESAKLRALWLQEQGFIEGSGSTSNRNVAHEFGDQRDESQSVLMSQVIDIIIDWFVKPALAMNFPMYEGSIDMKTLGFGKTDDDIVRQVIQLLGQAQNSKALLSTLGIEVRRLMESRGFPMMDLRAQKQLEDEAAKEAEQSHTPVVTPTDGRRSLVTQTGFGDETVYHELGGSIDLSTDGDFVSKLPKNDVFSDDLVVAATRDLRSTSSAFLSWIYGDFARYIGKQKSLNIEEALSELAAEALAEGDLLDDETRVNRLVAKLMNGWRPRAERLADFSKKSRSVLSRIFDRTASMHLDRISSKTKLSSVDKDAAAWLETKGASMVGSVLETTRSQLSEVLAVGVKARRTPSEIASDIRDHFTDMPASRASTIARTEVSDAYNFATITAGIKAGVKMGQLLDGNDDEPCKSRNGKIVKLVDALKEKLSHPNCTFTVRLLPRASANFDVRHEALDGLQARFDAASETVLLDPGISREAEAAYLISLGDYLAREDDLALEPAGV